jgi:hypothetical protein
LNPSHNLAGNGLQKLFLISYQAQAENMSVEAIIKQILEAIQVP